MRASGYFAIRPCLEKVPHIRILVGINVDANSHMPLLRPLLQAWGWHNVKRNVLFLSTPRLVFNPPVLKKNLVKGYGWLAKRFFAFDELFAAWGK